MEPKQDNKKVYIAAAVGFIIGFGACGLFFDNARSSLIGTKTDTDKEEEKATTTEEIIEDTGEAAGTIETSTEGAGETMDTPMTGVVDTAPVVITPGAVTGYAVVVNDQQAAKMVVLKQLMLQEPGWAVIHEDAKGAPGWILGAGWFPAGAQTEISVELLRPEGTTAGNVYYVMLHKDDGDKLFDFKKDLPLTDTSGSPVMMRFQTTTSAPTTP